MKNNIGKCVIVKDLEFKDYMKDENGFIKIFNTYDEALETCGIYEFENVIILKILFNYIEDKQ